MTIALTAPAKLTLSLRLTGVVRPDGRHEIDAEMVSLDFGDELALTPTDGTPSTVRFAGADVDVPAPADDLVARALDLAGRQASVEVTKHVPAGAGLGGGSSDAAAILRWAGYRDLVAAADTLGADVAYCIVGGRARVTGIGEIVEPLPFEPLTITLLTPPVRCPTGAVYKAWDELAPPPSPNGNDLEPAALAVQPELARWRDELATATGQQPRLAGSGSTWFVVGAFPGPGRQVTRTIPAP